MRGTIGIRRETKDNTQYRAPLTPRHVRELVQKQKVRVIVQPWANRVFRDDEYQRAGATLSDDLSNANIVFGVKEVGPAFIEEGQAYCCFSHTVKGQSYNMPTLRTLMDRENTLLDYELVKDSAGKRVVFFGDFAGYAGMIDTVWALGKRLNWEGIRNPFARVRYATTYESVADAARDFRALGRKIRNHGLDKRLVPFICGFTGYGRVSTAALQLFRHLPVKHVTSDDLPSLFNEGVASHRLVYAVTFRKPDMFVHKTSVRAFDVQEFRRYPERYIGRLKEVLPLLTLLVNGVYWEPGVPRLVTKRFVRNWYRREPVPRLRVIGDITCDLRGSIEPTVRITDSENPIFVYNPESGRVRYGWKGRGPVILAVDKLPTELPREASEAFGTALLPYVRRLARTDFSRPYARLRVPPEFNKSIIVHRGKLTPPYRHLKRYLGV
jgi:alpha-aminoadipic semialdehyde synthase